MNDFVVSLMLLGALSQNGTMPFWATANSYGIMPESSGALALVRAGTSFDESHTLQWRWGLSLGVRNDRDSAAGFIPDEAFASLRWKCLRLDAGLKRTEQDFLGSDPRLGSVSSTGGRYINSGNARTMPGASINLEPLVIPFTGGRLKLRGRFGDWFTTDTRYVRGSMVHNTAAFLEGRIGERLFLTAGIDHYTIWGGTSPSEGVFPKTFLNYLRILVGASGGSDAPEGERINALGDHRGSEILRADWRAENWTLTLQHDIPYEDRSGMIFRNFPDGVNTIALSFKDKDRWVSDVAYEFHYTMNQSGTKERRPATQEEIDSGDPRIIDGELILGGADNYTNNFSFKSGWTYYGRQIANPLFFPTGTIAGTVSRHTVTFGTENNLLKAHHLGVSGKLFRKLPYRLMLTYSENYGRYLYDGVFTRAYVLPDGSYADVPLRQFSSAFSAIVRLWRLPLSIIPSIYADAGDILPRGFGATLAIVYQL